MVIVLEGCHYLVVSYNRLSQGFGAAIFVDGDSCRSADSESISHFRGVCTSIAQVVDFLRQHFIDSFDCVACRFATCGTDSLDYVRDGHVLKRHW